MSLDYEGRVVVVTGATGALGFAVVQRLLEAGAVCHAPARSLSSAGKLEALDARRVKVVPGIDLASESSVAGFYAGLPSLWASVHCAGGFAMAPLLGTSLDDLHQMMMVNAVTCFLCCREALRRMTAGPLEGTGGGRIVNVAAAPALEPKRGAGMAAYAASKAVVASLTVSAGEEVRGRRIWVNAVAPSIMDTPTNRAASPGADYASWPKIEEVAETVAFLASPANRTVRGAVIPVPGEM